MVVTNEDRIIQKDPVLYTIFSNMPCGAAMEKIIFDESGVAVDYYTTEVNLLFCKLLNIPQEKIIGELASSHMNSDELTHWLDIFGLVAKEGNMQSFSMYSPLHKKQFTGKAVCPKLGFCFVMFTIPGMDKYTTL